MARAWVIGLLGAESTGKTRLAHDLGEALRVASARVAVVGEYLREFCDAAGRTPRIDEQAAIAAEQTRRIAAAALSHDIVVADTTALMIAVYSELVFGDRSLYASALADHARCDLTMLTALDLPWVADGLQRDGPQVREPVDALVRAALRRSATAYAVVSGRGPQRLANALCAVQAARRGVGPQAAPSRRWQWICERCGDIDCERHLLPPG